MSRTGFWCCLIAASAITFIVVAGCQTLHYAGVPGMEAYVKRNPAEVAAEKENREKFVLHRDHKALYWLLANRIENGLQLYEVEEILGGPGELTADFNGAGSEGLHQTTDTAYKWGPDNSGHSVVIWFRDGHVSNFTAKDYRNSDLKNL